MHECSLCEGIVKQVIRANHGKTVDLSSVKIEVGKLSGVDLDSLCFWFPVVSGKLNCPELKLEVIETDGVAHCNHCQHDFTLVNLYDACPKCNTHGDFTITSGRELLIKSFVRVE